MNDKPPEQRLSILSFATHSTRGLIRDARARRRTMLFVIAAAALLLVAGTTVFRDALNYQEHPVRFVLFWLACGWLTLTALLLALFDVLMIRAEAKRTQKELAAKVAGIPGEGDER